MEIIDILNKAETLTVKDIIQVDNCLIVQNKSRNVLEISSDNENWMVLNYSDVLKLSSAKTIYLKSQFSTKAFVAGEGVL